MICAEEMKILIASADAMNVLITAFADAMNGIATGTVTGIRFRRYIYIAADPFHFPDKRNNTPEQSLRGINFHKNKRAGFSTAVTTHFTLVNHI